MNKLNLPEQMTWVGNVAVLWRKWKQRFELYMHATGADAKDEDVKVAILLHVAGEKAVEIYNTFVFEVTADSKKLEKVLLQFDKYCSPRDTEVIERFKFRQRKQTQGELIDSFITDLKNIAQRCNFGDQEESLIRDGIIFGVQDVRLQERLLRECGLTLKRAIELCHAAEQTVNQLQAINAKSDASGLIEVDAIRKKKFIKRFSKPSSGKELNIPDTLSRVIARDNVACSDEQAINEKELELAVHTVSNSLSMTHAKKLQYRKAFKSDLEMVQISQYISDGWPKEKRHMRNSTTKYWHMRDELFRAEDFIMYNGRLLIPSCMRREVMDRLHKGHIGLTKMLKKARQTVFWHGMSSDIRQISESCVTCLSNLASHGKEEMIPHEIPDLPWTKLGIDFMDFRGQSYLVIIDYYSKFPEVVRTNGKSANVVIHALKSMFARYGIPLTVIADNMPFTSFEMKKFATEWEFHIVNTSPRYPQSNGQVERTVGVIKALWKKALQDGRDPYLALMEYRNTPLSFTNFSPAEALFNRRIRTRMPSSKKLLRPKIPSQVHNQIRNHQKSQEGYYNRSAKNLPVLRKGDSVVFKVNGQQKLAVVTSSNYNLRSYVVRTKDGHLWRRNRRHLSALPRGSSDHAGSSQWIWDADDDITSQRRTDPPRVLSPPLEVVNTDESNPTKQPDQHVTRRGRIVTLPARFKD